jgi:amino acid adenylation domain-containing protein
MRARPSDSFVEFDRGDVESCIPQRFRKQVERHAERIALGAGSGDLTYREVDRLSNCTAQALLERGTGPRPVGILLPRGVMIAPAVLGALKAGWYWVPLDLSLPPDRLRFLLEDSGAEVVLTGQQQRTLAEDLVGADRIINVDAVGDAFPDIDPCLAIDPQARSHIIYTSGSTGRPKGVVIDHRGVLHNVRIQTNSRKIQPGDRLSLLSPHSHTSGANDIYRALLTGASLHSFDPMHDRIGRLADWLEEARITILHLVPTLFRYLAQSLDGDRSFSRLRLIVLGGEAVTRHDVELFRKRFPEHCALVNHLGSTEVGTYSQLFVRHDTPLAGSLVPAGHVAEGKQVLILDQAGKPLDADRVGQIAIRSRFLSAGYWNQPELTRAAFSEIDGVPTFLTGDRGKLSEDGTLIHLGRLDSQVKIHGHRVELLEVESALLDLDGMRGAVVMVRQSPEDGFEELAAYVVSDMDPDSVETVARKALAEKLPRYMVPTRFVLIDELPRTTSGKIDRRAISVSYDERPAAPGRIDPPRNDLERELVDIWCEVFGRPVGIRDDFFNLGGHSMMAVRVFVALEERLGEALPIALLLHCPTIEQLAAAIMDPARNREVDPILRLRRGGVEPPLFILPGIGGHPFGFRSLVRGLHRDRCCYALQVNGVDMRSGPIDRLEELARVLIRSMRKVQPRGPYLLLGHSFGGVVAHEIARQLEAGGDTVARLVMLETPVPGARITRPVLQRLGIHVRRLMGQSASERLRYLRQRAARRWKLILGRGQDMDVQPNLSRVEQRAMQLRRANLRARGAHRPGCFSGEIVLFRAQEQPEWLEFYSVDAFARWDRYALGGVRIVSVPGDHLSVLYEPQVRHLIAELESVLP